MILNEMLFEHKQLNEKFSDSMPNWLRSRLLYLKSPVKDRDKYRNKGYNMDNQLYPNYSRRGSSRSLFWLFQDKGIDLDSAEFIDDGTIPTSSKDFRLKEPYIPIFLLEESSGMKRSQVYAKGINDDEIFELDGEGKKLGRVRPKNLLPYCRAFCYLDSSNPNNFKAATKKSERKQMERELDSSPLRRYNKKEREYYSWRNYDKSGYLINPKRLKDRLDDYYVKNYSKLVQKLYKRISDIKNDFAQIFMDTDIRDADARNNDDFLTIFNNYDGLNRQLMTLITTYNNFVSSLNNAADIQDENERDSRIKRVVKSYNSTLNDGIKKLESSAERVLSVDLDWD